VLFTILLVTGNTMAQSVRERTNELAVLKTLGFSGPSVLGLVLGESLLLAVTGGGLGLYLGWLIVKQGDPTGGMLPIWVLGPSDIVLGVVLIALLGTLAGLMPAVSAMRLKITDALRRA
jgi:putative ABC transport system permease protein